MCVLCVGVKDEDDSESDLNISTVSEESTAACGKVNICTPTDETHLSVFMSSDSASHTDMINDSEGLFSFCTTQMQLKLKEVEVGF